MTASMTGFGRAKHDGPKGSITIEIQSVNRKFLEVFISLPKEFARFENEVRKLVGEHAMRGQISVRMHYLPSLKALQTTLPNRELLVAMKNNWEDIANFLGFAKSEINLPFLLQYAVTEPSKGQQILELIVDEDIAWITSCLIEALQKLSDMKRKEGSALLADMKERIKILENHLLAIEHLSPNATNHMRKKLKERLEEVLEPSAALDERLVREIAFFAERVDITEEITRLKSHFTQYRTFFEKAQNAGGRKMDFLIQEMGREVNTIGSKAMDANIAHLVVEMKSELEKIREQIQNIE